MKNKLKIHTIDISHKFESQQDIELYRRVLLNSKVSQQVNNARTTAPVPSPSSYPDLMTEDQLIQFLQIPKVSSSLDYHNVVKNLIRMRDLPRIQICKKLLFPKKAILEWIEQETVKN